jgi:long-chain acyl-CoA synthetase
MSNIHSLIEEARANAAVGMEIAAFAKGDPNRSAVISDLGNLTFAQLNSRVNQLAHMLRAHGYISGDSIALLCGNRAEFIEVRFAAHRIGARLTTVNWHLAPEEIAYIVADCNAVALFADIRTEKGAALALCEAPDLAIKIAIGGEIEGFQNYRTALAPYPTSDIEQPCLGSVMQYTSGTTGRPKGVLRKQPDPEAAAGMQELFSAVFQFDPQSGTDKSLVTGPLYHSGPFNLSMTTPMTSGIGIVLMDKWEPEKTLRLIFEHKITHSFFVPTMFMRMLQLPESVKSQYALSSLRFVIHGAAPCAVEIKRQMLDWFGPIIWEIFAGTEGPGTIVSPNEWRSKPGTVGKPGPEQIKITDQNGKDVAAGTEGSIWVVNPKDSKFEYHNAPEKTLAAQRDGYFSAGDIGYLDTDGYLFITGRSAETIISGGVNIYPQEIDDVLLQHKNITDAACVGVPQLDMGEEVKAIVELATGVTAGSETAADILEFCQTRLAKQKWPRSIDFVEQIPRSEAGKVFRRQLRERYWQNEDKNI